MSPFESLVCPECGFNNEKGSQHCSNCGENLASICPICGNNIQFDHKFCSVCGFGFFNSEKILFSCSSRGVGGKAPIGEGVFTLTNYRCFFRLIKQIGQINTLNSFSINIECITKFKREFNDITIKTLVPKGKFKFICKDSKQLAKEFKNQKFLMKSGIIRSESQTNSTQRLPSFIQQTIPAGKELPVSKVNIGEPKKLSIGLGLLCFFIPFVGILFYFSDRKKFPKKAKYALLIGIFPTLILFASMAANPENQTRNSNSTNQLSNSQTIEDPEDEAITAVKQILVSDYQHFSNYEVTPVRGGYAVLIEDYALFWVKNGVVYSVNGFAIMWAEPGVPKASGDINDIFIASGIRN